MSLPILPAELKLNIFDHLDPGTALAFALSSKTHFELCKDGLQQHAELHAKYSIIRPTNEGHLIWNITKEIIQDPRKGWYVRELDLVTKRPGEYQNMPEEERELFKAAIYRLLPLYPYKPGFFANERSDIRELSDEMDDDLRRGFEASILILLIHHSPRLRNFRMTDNLMSDTLMLFLRRVAAAYQNPSLAPQMPLQHLRLATIAHDDTEGSSSLDWAVYFLCIPSLKTFAALMMSSEGIMIYGDDGEDDLRIAASGPVSNVEELFFEGCQFDPNSFDTLLPIIKNLKRFTYNAGGHVVAYQDYEPRKVIRALLNHSADSLEELALTEAEVGFQDGEDDIRSVSAQGFKKLKALHCESRWLLRGPGDASTDIDSDGDGGFSKNHHPIDNPVEKGFVYSKDPRDDLPESLEYLYLDGVHTDDEWREMVKMFETTNANTPMLRLDNTCIDRYLGPYKSTRYGRAVAPHFRLGKWLPDDIWKGHNSFL